MSPGLMVLSGIHTSVWPPILTKYLRPLVLISVLQDWCGLLGRRDKSFSTGNAPLASG
jgi:hypothetical protein